MIKQLHLAVLICQVCVLGLIASSTRIDAGEHDEVEGQSTKPAAIRMPLPTQQKLSRKLIDDGGRLKLRIVPMMTFSEPVLPWDMPEIDMSRPVEGQVRINPAFVEDKKDPVQPSIAPRMTAPKIGRSVPVATSTPLPVVLELPIPRVEPRRSTQHSSTQYASTQYPDFQCPSPHNPKVHYPNTQFSHRRFDDELQNYLSELDVPVAFRQDDTRNVGFRHNKTRDRALLDDVACETAPPLFYNDFSPTPVPQASMYHDGGREQWVYDAKYNVPTQHPWVEWGRIFYGDGITPRGKNWFGHTNMVRPEFYMYGDFRTGIGAGRNAGGRTDNWANRLNLDLDLRITDTERFHAFVGPLDSGGAFTRWERVAGDLRFRNEIDFTPVTGFFEGDLGAMWGGLTGQSSPKDLPITLGLVPLLFQNGIWMEDAVTGGAFSLPSRHSTLLNWSNYDATFFAVFDQLNSPAFGADANAAQAFGTAWFIEAYGGYIESGYAYVRDRNDDRRSYHNVTASFTRRYFDRISNSLRVIVNAGQDLDNANETADGVLLLVENSWITSNPLRVVPYANFFVGWDHPQSVARAGVSGGILRNTGINFDTDGLNGFATLDPTGSDTAGGSIGIDLLGDELDRQWLIEGTYLTPHGSANRLVPDDQFAVGSRYQFPISHRTLLRFDAMYGWRRGLDDVYGTRMEYRWKF